jgi:hypothetical protein
MCGLNYIRKFTSFQGIRSRLSYDFIVHIVTVFLVVPLDGDLRP